jgi:hypothetical protein
MPVPQPLQSRLIGALFVERGLVSESQVRVALEIQRETGQQLGQILVDRFGVSRKELASVVAQQWAKLGGSAGPEDNASWRRLGEIFVERGFVTQDELDGALERQRQTGERLGEALVAQGVISKFELAGALAEQMATLGDPDAKDEPTDEQAEATVHHLITADPSEVAYGTAAAEEEDHEEELAVVDEPVETTAAVELVVAAELVVADETESEPVEPALEETEPSVAVELVAAPEKEPEPVEPAFEETEPSVPVERVTAAWADSSVEDVEPTATIELSVAEEGEPTTFEPAVEEVEPIAPEELVAATDREVVENTEGAEPLVAIELVADAPVEAVEAPVEQDRDHEAEEWGADPFPEPTELLVLQGYAETNGDGVAEDDMAAIACLAFAPTTTGYRLLGLDAVPTPGETVDVPDVGEYLVLRIGRTPVPHDDRVCAFLEERVTPSLVEALSG